MSELIRHDDLNALRAKRFRVPETFQRGAWLTMPVNKDAEAAPGPTTTQLLLWLPVAEPALTWAVVEQAIGAPRGPTSCTAPAGAMGVLLDGAAGLDPTIAGDQWILRGTEYPVDEFGSIFWTRGWALGTPAGVLVSLLND